MACSGESKRAESTMSAQRTRSSRCASLTAKWRHATSRDQLGAGAVVRVEEVAATGLLGVEYLLVLGRRKGSAMVIEEPGQRGEAVKR